MPRDLFPRALDQTIIRAFLADKRHKVLKADYAAIEITNSQLRFTTRRAPAVAWYDTAGALCASLPNDATRSSAVLMVNWIMVELGEPENALVREVRDGDRWLTADAFSLKFFFQGNLVSVGQPFVLCGPLGVQAYRATLQKAPKR